MQGLLKFGGWNFPGVICVDSLIQKYMTIYMYLKFSKRFLGKLPGTAITHDNRHFLHKQIWQIFTRQNIVGLSHTDYTRVVHGIKDRVLIKYFKFDWKVKAVNYNQLSTLYLHAPTIKTKLVENHSQKRFLKYKIIINLNFVIKLVDSSLFTMVFCCLRKPLDISDAIF